MNIMIQPVHVRIFKAFLIILQWLITIKYFNINVSVNCYLIKNHLLHVKCNTCSVLKPLNNLSGSSQTCNNMNLLCSDYLNIE